MTAARIVTGTNAIDATTFVTRYQLAREATGSADANYNRQLRWQNPPSDTVITCSTYHVRMPTRCWCCLKAERSKR